ncbi:monomethylamine permease [Methanolobus mangrovi]|uniref:Monomethylamine permease n=1 Tax=Methanolobus mangrovi TaxID=3072977 RepID=A0AA51YG85_9EURY|nr:monomethylamine permease [Methanolobus mangrovi]WMW21707.1 monomethylamine permease [Methanolobus mangrovi]
MDGINEAKYKGAFAKDTYLIAGAIALLIIIEGYVVYNVLSLAGPAVSSSIIGIYVLFFGLVVGIEIIGYWQVRHSIKQHMFDFKYYD